MNTFHDRELEDTIAAFELQKKQKPTIDVASFFPPVDHPIFDEIAVELLRVDLEYAWEDGARDRLDEYRTNFPVLLNVPKNLNLLAFEEYRLRHQDGEIVDKRDYEERLRIDASDWPSFSAPTDVEGHESLENNFDQVPFPEIGWRLLDFDLVAELGRGTFSRVFIARQGELADRFVVVKTSTQRWIESDLLARLQHPNIVPIFSMHRVDKLQIVCMPFLGCSTARRSCRAICTRSTREIDSQIGRGLAEHRCKSPD